MLLILQRSPPVPIVRPVNLRAHFATALLAELTSPDIMQSKALKPQGTAPFGLKDLSAARRKANVIRNKHQRRVHLMPKRVQRHMTAFAADQTARHSPTEYRVCQMRTHSEKASMYSPQSAL